MNLFCWLEGKHIRVPQSLERDTGECVILTHKNPLCVLPLRYVEDSRVSNATLGSSLDPYMFRYALMDTVVLPRTTDQTVRATLAAYKHGSHLISSLRTNKEYCSSILVTRLQEQRSRSLTR